MALPQRRAAALPTLESFPDTTAVQPAVSPRPVPARARGFGGGFSAALARRAGGGFADPRSRYSYFRHDPFDPRGQIEKGFGPEARAFYESGGVDPRVSSLLRSRLEQESGQRGRSALLGLQARGADIPGSYGVAALLSELGASSDLSRGLTDLGIEEARGAQSFKQQQLASFLDYLRELEKMQREQEGAVSRQKLQGGQERQTQRAGRRGAGISLGFGPASISFATGGVVDRPTNAMIGEFEDEAVVPVSRLLAALSNPENRAAFGQDLIRARAEAAAKGRGRLTGGSMDGPADQDSFSPPIPFREPDPVRPEGWLENLASILSNVRIGAGPEAGGAAQAGAAGLGILSMLGSRRLKGREQQRESTAEFVRELNRRQREGFLEEGRMRRDVPAAREPRELVYDETLGTYVEPSVSRRLQTERGIRKLPPRPTAPRASRPDVEVGRFVGDLVTRLGRARSPEELAAIEASIGESGDLEVSDAQLTRIKAARQAAKARIQAAGGF